MDGGGRSSLGFNSSAALPADFRKLAIAIRQSCTWRGTNHKAFASLRLHCKTSSILGQRSHAKVDVNLITKPMGDIMNGYLATLKKYADFSGRARRTEYWLFFLFNFVIAMVLGVLDFVLGTPGILGLIFALAILIPSIAVAARRLHDTDRSGWWILIAFIPIVGTIALLVFLLLDSTPGENRFGSNPKAIAV